MSDPHDVLSNDNLSRYEVPKAPPGFADRVMTRIARAQQEPVVEEPVARKRSHRKLALVAGAASIAATLTLGVFLARNDSADMMNARSLGTGSAAMESQRGDGKSDLKLDPSGPIAADGIRAQGQSWAYSGSGSALVTGTGKQQAEFKFDHNNTESYSKIDDNPYHAVAKEPLSTFSIDVDTASYANIRRFLADGRHPPKDAVRIEEMINYFKYDYPAPAQGEPFSITTDVATSPWNPKYQLVRIGLATPAIPDEQVPARNLVFLIDVSGSMFDARKLPLLKQSMQLLVDTLRPNDKVSIVTYAGNSGLVLPATTGKEKDAIRNAIQRLEPGGSTNGASGIQLAYDVAARAAIKGGINRVILCTDGDFNVGLTSEGDLVRLIEKERERGVFLTVLGFGMGNYKDATLEKLADRGNGNHAYIDTIDEARKVLVKEAGATLVTVAKDVKLQVEFNPAKVAGYRLVGYENRLLAARDFNDDKKDAGEIGAGRSVTALYEIIPAGVDVPNTNVDALKYQSKTTPTGSSELLTVKIRYKAPDGDKSKLLSRAVEAEPRDLASSSVDFRWAAAMASFGMMLRESSHRGNLSWAQVKSLAEGALGSDLEGYRKNALVLIDKASKLPPASP